MRILYYNWVDYEDPEGRGGGVSVYQRNLIAAALTLGDEVTFLSSGIRYDLLGRQPYVRTAGTGAGGVRKLEIVNSPFLSPGQLTFHDDLRASPAMEQVFADFLARYGPFDVVHFNNLEGIPLSFVELAGRQTPRPVVLFSLHNYFPFCPQVNLWFQEQSNCGDFAGGRKCVNCLPERLDTAKARRDYRLQTLLSRLRVQPKTRLYELGMQLLNNQVQPLYHHGMQMAKALRGLFKRGRAQQQPAPTESKLRRLQSPELAARFAQRRAAFVAALNQHTDHVLAVSGRVAELAVQLGIRPERVRTAYIGTRFAQPATPRPPAPTRQPNSLSIAYLGYMRTDKGFYFLLRALETMPTALAQRLRLTIAARLTDSYAVQRLRRIAHKLQALTLIDGYTHADLPAILSGVDLGLVPVLWEDNLPQVALEFVGLGVPVLTSDLGGAREVLGCPELTFTAGSPRSFYLRLQQVLDDPDLLRRALAGRMKLLTPGEHYQHLRTEYYSRRSACATDVRRSA